MLKFFHKLLNPHCPHCREEKQESQNCKSCDILQIEVERLRADNDRLLTRILEKPQVVEERTVAPEPTTTRLPRQVPWIVRRQMLEAEDREKAKILAQAAKPQSTEELEKELDIASTAREAEGQNTAKS